MIHEIGVELEASLHTKGATFLSVVDGPERTKTSTWARERIVLEHDGAGDTFGPVIGGAHKNPRHRMTVNQGFKLTIYAQSPSSGAMDFEHRRRAEHIRDLVLDSIYEIAQSRKNRWSPKAGKFITPEEFANTESFGGAVYELTFSFDRAVFANHAWSDPAKPQGTLAGFASVTKVSQVGDPLNADPLVPPADAETACGG